MPAWLHAFRASFTFLSRIPVGGFPYPADTWKWISLWFPVVGLILGAMQASLLLVLPPSVSFFSQAIIIVGFGMLLTGGFHEDGLGDTADALGGAYDKEGILRILKDSRIGAFGALAIVVVVLLRISLLSDLGTKMWLGLVLGQSLSRATSVLQLALIPYARREDEKSKSRDVAISGPIQALSAIGWMFIILFFAATYWLSMVSVIGLISAMVFTLVYLSWRFYKRLGGITGDFLGCTQQISEVVILLSLVCI